MVSSFPTFELTTRPLSEFERDFYTVMLEHYRGRAEVCQASIIKTTVKSYETILKTNSIVTKEVEYNEQ